MIMIKSPRVPDEIRAQISIPPGRCVKMLHIHLCDAIRLVRACRWPCGCAGVEPQRGFCHIPPLMDLFQREAHKDLIPVESQGEGSQRLSPTNEVCWVQALKGAYGEGAYGEGAYQSL